MKWSDVKERLLRRRRQEPDPEPQVQSEKMAPPVQPQNSQPKKGGGEKLDRRDPPAKRGHPGQQEEQG